MPRRRNSQPSTRPSGRMTANWSSAWPSPCSPDPASTRMLRMWTRAKNRALRIKRRSLTQVAQPGGQREAPEEGLLADGRHDRRREHDGQRLDRAVGIRQDLRAPSPAEHDASSAAPDEHAEGDRDHHQDRDADIPRGRAGACPGCTRRPAHLRATTGPRRGPRTARCTRGRSRATTNRPSEEPDRLVGVDEAADAQDDGSQGADDEHQPEQERRRRTRGTDPGGGRLAPRPGSRPRRPARCRARRCLRSDTIERPRDGCA